MTFSPLELKYIHDAVYEYDGEYERAPNDLLKRLEDWLANQKELCRHMDTKIVHGYPQNDGTVPAWSYCNECGIEGHITFVSA
jgi:hypothetical protein